MSVIVSSILLTDFNQRRSLKQFVSASEIELKDLYSWSARRQTCVLPNRNLFDHSIFR